jgi:hypothetical protein
MGKRNLGAETRTVQVTPSVAVLMTTEWATIRPESQRKLKGMLLILVPQRGTFEERNQILSSRTMKP